MEIGLETLRPVPVLPALSVTRLLSSTKVVSSAWIFSVGVNTPFHTVRGMTVPSTGTSGDSVPLLTMMASRGLVTDSAKVTVTPEVSPAIKASLSKVITPSGRSPSKVISYLAATVVICDSDTDASPVPDSEISVLLGASKLRTSRS
ncbi:hypothetical protein XMD510_002350 [Marinobacterium sp. xm-d-510]|nr:hypothetical protein [Marinobacterium sp. xm-d-510]